jgi:hypothetical protein
MQEEPWALFPPAGLAVPASSKLSTEDDATGFKGEYCSASNSGLISLEMETDRIEDRSVDEMLDLRVSSIASLVVTTVMVTLLFMRKTTEELQEKTVGPSGSRRTNIVNELRTDTMVRGK